MFSAPLTKKNLCSSHVTETAYLVNSVSFRLADCMSFHFVLIVTFHWTCRIIYYKITIFIQSLKL